MAKMGWLALILWIITPTAIWSYANNMIENTLGIFTLASVMISYRTFPASGQSHQALAALRLADLFCYTDERHPGILSVAAPLLYHLVTGKIGKLRTFWHTMILVAVPMIIYVVLYVLPESRESLSTYFFKRALHRIKDVPTVGNRFYIVGHLLMELIPHAILLLILVMAAGKARLKNAISSQGREAAFFICVGLSASSH
jgi:hypothetical protein